MADLKEITKAAKNFLEERQWNEFRGPKDEAIDLVVEAAEVLEHFQWKTEEELKEYIARNKGEIADELGDVLFGLALLADKLNIDLQEAFFEKLRKTAGKYPIEKSRGKRKKWNEL